MTGFELQRTNMVESQVRPSDVTDRRIMRAMLALRREEFAAPDTRELAYMEEDLRVGPQGPGRRALLAPRVLAKLIQQLEIAPEDRVLEIGTATGYGAAVLASMAKRVVALEIDPALATAASTAIAAHGIGNVTVVTGSLRDGWKAEAPYAGILVSGMIPEAGPELLDQLRDGGRLVAVVCEGTVGRIKVWQRFGSSYAQRVVADASALPLPGFEKASGFVF